MSLSSLEIRYRCHDMKPKSRLTSIIVATAFVLSVPTIAGADNLLRVFPFLTLSGTYTDNVRLSANNTMGDFIGTAFAGFFLDLTSPERQATFQWNTAAQLFVTNTEFDRAGEAQFMRATDVENLGSRTRLNLGEYFARDSPINLAVGTSEPAATLNEVFGPLLLSNDQATSNLFEASLDHDWSRDWSSQLGIDQRTLWVSGGGTSYQQGVEVVGLYHYNEQLSFGPGYKFSDFRFQGGAGSRPATEDHWPFLKGDWEPTYNLSLEGTVGLVVSNALGTGRQTINPAGIGTLEYRFRRGNIKIYGGQEPSLTDGLGGAGFRRSARGSFTYYLTQRLSAKGAVSYGEFFGPQVDAWFVTYGIGLNERINQWLTLYCNYINIRRESESGSSTAPQGLAVGQQADGNYFVLGMDIAFEGYRWSWP